MYECIINDTKQIIKHNKQKKYIYIYIIYNQQYKTTKT